MQIMGFNPRSSSQGLGQTSAPGNAHGALAAKHKANCALPQWPGNNPGTESILRNLANLIKQLLMQLENMHKPKPRPTEYRSIDGVGNNKKNPTWGSAGIQHQRRTPQDSSREPGGSTEQRLSNPRTVSNAVVAQGCVDTVNQKGL